MQSTTEKQGGDLDFDVFGIGVRRPHSAGVGRRGRRSLSTPRDDSAAGEVDSVPPRPRSAPLASGGPVGGQHLADADLEASSNVKPGSFLGEGPVAMQAATSELNDQSSRRSAPMPARVRQAEKIPPEGDLIPTRIDDQRGLAVGNSQQPETRSDSYAASQRLAASRRSMAPSSTVPDHEWDLDVELLPDSSTSKSPSGTILQDRIQADAGHNSASASSQEPDPGGYIPSFASKPRVSRPKGQVQINKAVADQGELNSGSPGGPRRRKMGFADPEQGMAVPQKKAGTAQEGIKAVEKASSSDAQEEEQARSSMLAAMRRREELLQKQTEKDAKKEAAVAVRKRTESAGSPAPQLTSRASPAMVSATGGIARSLADLGIEDGSSTTESEKGCWTTPGCTCNTARAFTWFPKYR
ncbi:unnamed protein product [Ostreobium quekettii]|uniref:Uncharacterized protein n=1 Tax=Ostreobium quekettii TaxID=121088 RepID=A0A8S1IQ71_9CHLO|nr:unnamed protein product [Ostreobium quekettii]